MKIERKRAGYSGNCSMTVVSEEYPDHTFYYINYILDGNNVSDVDDELRSYLKENDLKILLGFFFGSKSYGSSMLFTDGDPVMFLNTGKGTSQKIQLVCTNASNVINRVYNGDTCLRTLKHYGTELFFVSNIFTRSSDSLYSQASLSFESMKTIMNDLDIDYDGFVRTWIYLDDILDCYDDLNRARTNFFNTENIYEHLVPASTGIGLSNQMGAKVIMSTIFIKGNTVSSVREVNSPEQCPARDYRSSFSRAVEIDTALSGRLLISGTASIDRDGNTVCQGDVKKQILKTINVISAIIEQEDYQKENIVRAIAYFTDISYIDAFYNCCLSAGIDPEFILPVTATICRDDLLFEIELDLIKPKDVLST